jgi:hypothetical protein
MKKHWVLLAIVLAGFGMGPIGCMQADQGEKAEHGEHAERGEHGEKGEEKESDEVKVSFGKIPAAVQATFSKEADGVAIKEVDQEKLDGKDVYEADAVIGGTNYEIVVAPDGKLVSKKIDNEAAEGDKKETGEKEEADEKGEKKD